jgi:uncharacterized membrane protein AbrB (regulator of aidB expression)
LKTLLCLLIASGVGTALQYAGLPHGLLLGSILASALIASNHPDPSTGAHGRAALCAGAGEKTFDRRKD